MKITVDRVAAPKWKRNLAGLKDRVDAALSTAANMIASMIQDAARADIASAGNFGAAWQTGLHVEVEQSGLNKMRIAMYHDDPRAGIFETGGTIQGHPLLWLPFSGNPRIADNSEDLFSATSKSGKPLLLSKATKTPKYFGVPQVSIPQKFHLRETQSRVLENFREVFDTAFRSA